MSNWWYFEYHPGLNNDMRHCLYSVLELDRWYQFSCIVLPWNSVLSSKPCRRGTNVDLSISVSSLNELLVPETMTEQRRTFITYGNGISTSLSWLRNQEWFKPLTYLDISPRSRYTKQIKGKCMLISTMARSRILAYYPAYTSLIFSTLNFLVLVERLLNIVSVDFVLGISPLLQYVCCRHHMSKNVHGL